MYTVVVINVSSLCQALYKENAQASKPSGIECWHCLNFNPTQCTDAENQQIATKQSQGKIMQNVS